METSSLKRNLDIGPGNTRLEGFETVDVVPGRNVDHVADGRRLPFPDNTFNTVHSSHCIEHVPWYDVESTINEWARVVKQGGSLEVWTVNAYKIMKALIDEEEGRGWSGPKIGTWKQEWVQHDPYKWSAGRLFCYKKGDSDAYLHKSMFTPKYLMRCFEQAGLKDIRLMDETEIRGKRHPWINMGVRGIK